MGQKKVFRLSKNRFFEVLHSFSYIILQLMLFLQRVGGLRYHSGNDISIASLFLAFGIELLVSDAIGTYFSDLSVKYSLHET